MTTTMNALSQVSTLARNTLICIKTDVASWMIVLYKKSLAHIYIHIHVYIYNNMDNMQSNGMQDDSYIITYCTVYVSLQGICT